ncbi:uncharacterized protein LOC135397726 [Ornithodoros turicata]|uniref:uncharacterized protein LOC135397726 n=1 Tax=Ornithodoros turicata TaxID=34597 RepID=UPI0031389886
MAVIDFPLHTSFNIERFSENSYGHFSSISQEANIGRLVPLIRDRVSFLMAVLLAASALTPYTCGTSVVTLPAVPVIAHLSTDWTIFSARQATVTSAACQHWSLSGSWFLQEELSAWFQSGHRTACETMHSPLVFLQVETSSLMESASGEYQASHVHCSYIVWRERTYYHPVNLNLNASSTHSN